MIKAEDVINREKDKLSITEMKDKYHKCTICGLYGTKEEITSDTVIDGNIYVSICCNCKEYLNKGGKIKKRKYFPEELEDINEE